MDMTLDVSGITDFNILGRPLQFKTKADHLRTLFLERTFENTKKLDGNGFSHTNRAMQISAAEYLHRNYFS